MHLIVNSQCKGLNWLLNKDFIKWNGFQDVMFGTRCVMSIWMQVKNIQVIFFKAAYSQFKDKKEISRISV